MSLKLFEMEGEFGYAAETLAQVKEAYDLDDCELAEVHERPLDDELSIAFHESEDPIVPSDARVEPGRTPGYRRAIAPVRSWLALQDGPGEVWNGYD